MSYEQQYNPKLGYPGPVGQLDAQWVAHNVAWVEMPFPLINAYNTDAAVTRIQFHRLGVKALLAALQAIWAKADFLTRSSQAWQVERMRIKAGPAGPNQTTAYYDQLMASFTWQHTLALLDAGGCRLFGGSFVHRAVRGTTNTLSPHSWAAAIDWDPARNPMGQPLRCNLPMWWVQCWEDNGFRWGGAFHNRPDPMHVELDETKL